MRETAVQVTPLHDALGARVEGIDLTRPLDDAAGAELAAAFDRHHLLVFRGQEVSEQAQIDLSARFGPLIDEMNNGSFAGFISNVLADAAGSGELPFHSDLSFTTSPVIGISLCAQELPATGTSTWFASSAHAWRTLPADLRRAVEGHAALHTLSAISTGSSASKSREHPIGEHDPSATHPIPMLHPRTGEPLLYLTDLHAASIEGDADGSLLEALLAHLYAPANVYEHRWELGDLVVWDNLALQHRRNDVTGLTPRTFRRVSLNHYRFFELVPLMPTE